ncbi:MAG TPA: hypothetical protein VMR59_01765 [Patescibacteria group bacterium]|jgi:hypothetical protein|nr:hypothetical protein [Patescibacteria group bacterium]
MTEITPAFDQPVEPKLPSLPANGRKPGFRTKVALGVAGLAAAATGVAGCILPIGPGKSEAPSTTPSGIVEQSTSPVPIPYSSESPIVVPSELPSAPASPESTLSPEAQLQQEITDYLDGTTQITNLFFKQNSDKTPAPLNILDTNTDFSQPTVTSELQGYNIGQIVEYDANNSPYLVELIGLRDGTAVDPANPGKGRFIIKADLGRLDNPNDRDTLNTQAGIIIAKPSQNTVSETLTVTQMQQRLQQYDGATILFDLHYMTGDNVQGPDLPSDRRSKAEMRAQNEIAKETIQFCEQTLIKPYAEVPMSDLLKTLIITQPNQFTNNTFNVSSVPTVVTMTPYT